MSFSTLENIILLQRLDVAIGRDKLFISTRSSWNLKFLYIYIDFFTTDKSESDCGRADPDEKLTYLHYTIALQVRRISRM